MTTPYYKALRLAISNDYDLGSANAILDLGRVNFLVGQNHAGKSRFLRSLLAAQSYTYQPSNPVPNDVRKLSANLSAQLAARFTPLGISGYGPIPEAAIIAKYGNTEWFTEGSNPIVNLISLLKALVPDQQWTAIMRGPGHVDPSVVSGIHRQFAPLYNELLSKIEGMPQLGGETRVYIPSIRGIRPLGGERESDLYASRTQRDYQIDPTQTFTCDEPAICRVSEIAIRIAPFVLA